MNNRYKYIDEGKQHLHTLDGQPLYGTSTVLKVIAKPLTYWASGLAVEKLGWIKIQDKLHNISDEIKSRVSELGLVFKKGSYSGVVAIPKEVRKEYALKGWNKIVGLSGEEFLDLLDEAYKAHATKLDESADAGTDMHACLESYVKNTMLCQKTGMVDTTEYTHEAVKIFAEWAKKNVKRFLFSEMHCYSEKYWLGGITDAGYEKFDGTYGIMDFKSSKDAYLSQFWQIGGYDLEISENGGYDAEGNKVFELDKPFTEYAVFPFGMAKPEPQFYYDMAGAKEAYISALTLYKKMEI